MDLGLQDSLASLVSARYESARASNALTFSPTKLAILRHPSGQTFQLRLIEALAKKPTPQTNEHKQDKKSFNPFEDPTPDLLVTRIPAPEPTHNIVLNKYPIIAQHFILATSSFKQQTHLLEAQDLTAAYACLASWTPPSPGPRPGPQVLAFFNSGPASGASQPHRHIQFLPISSMSADGPSHEAWEPLISTILRSQAATHSHDTNPGPLKISQPFKMYTYAFATTPPSAEGLRKIYLSLLAHAFSVQVEEVADKWVGGVSYNMAMTTEGMVICRREKEAYIYEDEEGEHVVACNGTILAGTLLVKGEREWEWLRREEGALGKVLDATVGKMDGGRYQDSSGRERL